MSMPEASCPKCSSALTVHGGGSVRPQYLGCEKCDYRINIPEGVVQTPDSNPVVGYPTHGISEPILRDTLGLNDTPTGPMPTPLDPNEIEDKIRALLGEESARIVRDALATDEIPVVSSAPPITETLGAAATLPTSPHRHVFNSRRVVAVAAAAILAVFSVAVLTAMM